MLWGKHNIQFTLNDYPPDNNYKEHCMSLGLAWLRRLALASTYDERYRLLAVETGTQEPSFIYKTFYDPYDVQESLIDLSDLRSRVFFLILIHLSLKIQIEDHSLHGGGLTKALRRQRCMLCVSWRHSERKDM